MRRLTQGSSQPRNPGLNAGHPDGMALVSQQELSDFQRTPQRGVPTRTDRILSDPDRVLVRLDSFIDAYGARATLYEMWTQNPSLFELLLLLFDRSEFLAEQAIRAPDLVDELQSSGRLNRAKSAEETLADLRHGAGDADQHLWLRRYHLADLMRIGLRDILGLADFEQKVFDLSSLADACPQYGLEVLVRAHRDSRMRPFAWSVWASWEGGRSVTARTWMLFL